MISDERLREAARKVEESMLASLPEPEECEATFSPEFERKMERLLHRADHPIRKRIMKAVACFLLAVLVGGGSVLTFSLEARATFVTWMKEVYETHFVYRLFRSDQESSSNSVYRPTWVPLDFEMISETILDSASTIVYKNDANEIVVFTCFQDTGSATFQIEGDHIESCSQVFINGISADMYLDSEEGESNVIIWADEGEGTMFRISAPFGENELVRMAESIIKYEQ